MKKIFILISVNLFITLYYRAEHFRLFVEKSALENLTFYNYLQWVLPKDIFAIALISFVGFILFQFSKIFSFVLLILLEIFVILYYAISLGYYKLYESLFEIRELENLPSILSELIFSIQGELDHRLVNFILINVTYMVFLLLLKKFRFSHFLLSLVLVVTAFPQALSLNSHENLILKKEELKNPIWEIFFVFQKKKESFEEVNFPILENLNLFKKSHPPISVPRKKYSVVFYFFESMSAKYVDFTYQGQEVCPNWRRLRENSLFMKNHYANFPLSINSFFNVFCSLPALPDGRWLSLVKPDIPHKCAAEILAEAGYRTAIFHAGDPDYASQRRFYKYHPAQLIVDNHDLQKFSKKKFHLPWAAADERLFVEKAIEFAKENKKNFFITLFAFSPHHPYAVPEDFPKFVDSIPENLPYEKKAFLRYLNSLHFADFVLGELVDQFEKEGLAQDTLFFIFADHGEAFYEHKGNFNHPYYLYQENVHVPFIIYNRKIFPKSIFVEKNTSHLDILPTLLDFLQIPPKKELWGKSILKGGREEFIYLQTFWNKEWLGLIYGNHKYLYRPLDNRREFYDLSKDPMEKNNEWESYKSLAENYHALLLLDKKRKEEFFMRYLGKL